MSISSAAEQVRKAGEALQAAQAEALGAVQRGLQRITAEHPQEREKLEARLSRQLLRTQNQSRDQVSAAEQSVKKAASSLSEGEGAELLRVAETVRLGRVQLEVDHLGLPSPMKIPVWVPLFGSGNIVVLGEDESGDDLVRGILREAAKKTAPGELEVKSYDPKMTTPLAPFKKLNDAVGGLISTATTERDLDRLLEDLTGAIARVSDLLQGSEHGFVQHRTKVGMPVEKYRLILFEDYPTKVDKRQHQTIRTLVSRAARHGLAFVFRVRDPKSLPEWLDLNELLSHGQHFKTKGGAIQWSEQPKLPVKISKVTPEQLARTAAQIAEDAEKASIPSVPMEGLLPGEHWRENTIDGVRMTLGAAGPDPVEVSLDDNTVHALITGATGQGKSNLIKALVYNAAARYSPDELALYLLDFKEGVTLRPMAKSTDSPEYLPHARVLGVEADQDFGLAVLREMERENKRRLNAFGKYNAEKLSDYRRANPDDVMPRIVVIIDEFQGVLSMEKDRKKGERAAQYLLKLAREGRAAGIHVVLASQEISSIPALQSIGAQGLFAQFRLRIGLKNSVRAAEATFEQGNTDAARLRFRGQAVVNREAGDSEANSTVMGAEANDAVAQGLREQWSARTEDHQQDLPVLFEGSKPAEFELDLAHIQGNLPQGQDALYRAYLGRPLTVDQRPLTFSLEEMPGRNLVIVGSGTDDDDLLEDDEPSNNLALGMLQSASLSLGLQYTFNEKSVKFVFLDLLSRRERNRATLDVWTERLGSFGHTVEQYAGRDDVFRWLSRAPKVVEWSDPDYPTFVFGLGLEQAGNLQETVDLYPGNNISGFKGVGRKTVQDRPADSLFKLLDKGPQRGVYSFMWWAQATRFLDAMNLQSIEKFFTGTVLLHGASKASEKVHGYGAAPWEGEPNRGLYGDASGSQDAKKLIPYGQITRERFQLNTVQWAAV